MRFYWERAGLFELIKADSESVLNLCEGQNAKCPLEEGFCDMSREEASRSGSYITWSGSLVNIMHSRQECVIQATKESETLGDSLI